MAERLPEPAVQQSIEVELTLIGHYDRLRTDLALALVQTAKAHEAQTVSRLRSIPGVGKILALVLLYEIHAIRRFPRGQAFVSSCRLVNCAKAAAGTREGSSGKKMGTAYLKWAVSAAAVLFLRNNPAGQQSLPRFARQHGTGKAVTLRAPKVARAVYDMLKRHTACALDKCLREEWSGAGEPAASRAAEGSSLASAGWQP